MDRPSNGLSTPSPSGSCGRSGPIADEECHLVLIERKGTKHTGDVVMEKTRSIAAQLRSL
jgi:hypothetical protein